jgi:hypothetical protein
MARGEANRFRVGTDVIEPDRYRVAHQEPQHSPAGGQGSDLEGILGVEPNMNEVNDNPIGAQDPESPVLGVNQVDSRVDDSPEGGTEFKARGDSDHRIE